MLILGGDKYRGIENVTSVDRRSASRMLRVLLLVSWALAGIATLSALLGYGSRLSNLIATAWFIVLSIFLLIWPHLAERGHRAISLLMLLFIVTRWSVAWLVTDPEDAMVGVVLGLLYVPVLLMVSSLLWGRLGFYIGAITGVVMGAAAVIGSGREVLASVHLDDWRIGPLVLAVYLLFSWLLGIWVRERYDLRENLVTTERLRRDANTDALTGIANRRAAEHALSMCGNGHRRYAVMMADIDHFKQINDQHGHDAGDRILQRIADVLKRRTRAHDIVARWGGEEFLVIVESATREDAAAIAESLRVRVEEDTVAVAAVTISIGVAHSDSGHNADQIVKRADEGLYAAKNSGRNKVVTV